MTVPLPQRDPFIVPLRGIYERVVAGIARLGDNLELGGPKEADSTIGPLICAKQPNRVLGHIDQGRSDGVEYVTGGHRVDRQGYFVQPTVATNVDPETSRLFQEEIFGPVVTILPSTPREAVALANNSTGLAATVWAKDLGRAHRLAKNSRPARCH